MTRHHRHTTNGGSWFRSDVNRTCSPQDRQPRRTRQLLLETLEDRRLLSADLWLSPPQQILENPQIAALQWGNETAYAYRGQWIAKFDEPSAVQSQAIVTAFSSAAPGSSAAAATTGSTDGFRVRPIGKDGTFLIEASPKLDFGQVKSALAGVPGFRYAEPNFVRWLTATVPNDSLFTELWGMDNTGQNGGTPDADIDAPEAWDISTGSNTVVVGVIDTGVDYTHPDLMGNMWINPIDSTFDGIDQDGNGYTDDVYGWDFINGDSDPMDDIGHGTHCSGTIGGVGDNGVGVAGVNWSVQIMGLKIFAPWGTTDAAIIESIQYATMMKRDFGVNMPLTSNSWGGGGYSQALKDAIDSAGTEGQLFIAAAGNWYGNDNDISPFYPASYDSPNIIAVAATDRWDQLSGFSNYGATSVDLGAPGSSILSTVPGAGYAYYDGTSMATPHVSGVAALAWSFLPNATAGRIKDAILAGVDPLPALTGKTLTGGRLNAFRTLQELGLHVVSTSPADGELVAAPPTSFVVGLSDPYDPTTVQETDLTVNGIPADNYALTDPNTITFTYNSSPVTDQGLQTMALDAGAILRDGDSQTLAAFRSTFRYDAVLMAVVATAPDASLPVIVPMTQLDVTFNEPYDPLTLDTSDLVLSRGVVVGAAPVDPLTVRYTLDGLTEEGPVDVLMTAMALTDVFGNPMQPFATSFGLDVTTTAYPAPFAAKEPLGSLVYDPPVSGWISPTGDTDSFTMSIDAGQTITVVADPDGTLQATVELRDPGGVPIGTATGPAAGMDVVLQTVPVGSAGTYTLAISGGGTTGAYDVQIILNAAAEEENHDGPTNDTAATAQNLAAAFLPLAENAQRAAVLGEITPVPVLPAGGADFLGRPLSLGFAGDGSFVGPTIGAQWNGIEFVRYGAYVAGYSVAFNGYVYVNQAAIGRTDFPVTLQDLSEGTNHVVRVYGTPQAGVEFQRLVQWQDGDNFAFVTDTLTNNTAGSLSNVATLENVDPDPGGFTPTSNDVTSAGQLVAASAPLGAMGLGSTDPRAVVSADGFFVIDPFQVIGSPIDPNGAVNDIAINLAFDLGTLASGASVSTTFAMAFGADQSAVEAAFAAAGAPPFAGYHDDASDWYRFSLADGESVTLAATSLDGGGLVQLDLFAADGSTLLATGIPAANLTAVINNFVDRTTDRVPQTYFARLSGLGMYDLVVTRNADFDTEANNDFANAQDLSGIGGALGHVKAAASPAPPVGLGSDRGGAVALASTTSSPGPQTQLQALPGQPAPGPRSTYPAGKQLGPPASVAGPLGAAFLAATPAPAQVLGGVPVLQSFPGPGYTGFIPPDPTAAAGPEQLVAYVNCDIAIYDKATGDELYRDTATNFFSEVGSTTYIFDPWVLYDTDTQRFFLIGIDIASDTQSNLFLAVSKTSTPTGAADWHKFKLDFTDYSLGTGAHFPDYPKMGVNADAIWISGNYFPISSGSDVYAGLTAIEKAPLLSGAAANVVWSEFFYGFSVMPMTQYNSGSTQYFAETSWYGGNWMNIHAVTDVLTSPARSTTTMLVPSYDPPLSVPQLGGGQADAIDSRLMTGVWRNGSLYVAHNIEEPADAEVKTEARWYEVATNNYPFGPPTLVQAGDVDAGPDLWTWMPSVAVDGAGNMGIGFAIGGPNQYYGAGFTGRLAADLPGTTVLPVTEYAVGQGNYGSWRWGDYTGMSVDPADDATFWAFNEYATAAGNWATQAASFQLQAPGDEDWYRFNVAAGAQITLQTSTPGDGPYEPVNLLDPAIELYAPDGSLVAQNDNAAPDWRNAALSYHAGVAGQYRARVTGVASEGDYFLSLTTSLPLVTPPEVVATNPADGQLVNQFPATLTVDFSESLLLTSVQPGDLRINGAPAGTAVTVVDGDTFTFTLKALPTAADGTYTVEVLPGAVNDLQGTPNVAYRGTFVLDTTSPRLMSTAWNGSPMPASLTLGEGPLTLAATFSEPLMATGSARRGLYAPGRDDVWLSDTLTGLLRQPLSVALDPTGKVFTAQFDTLPEGLYELRLVSGANAFEDRAGNALDGEPLGAAVDKTPTGNKAAGGDYFLNFSVDPAGPRAAHDFVRLQPLGSLIFESERNAGVVNQARDQDDFTFYADSTEKVAAIATTASATALLTLELVGTGVSVTASAPGLPVVLPVTALTATGMATVRVSGNAVTTYTLDIYRNAALEAQVGDSADGRELPIGPSFLNLGSGRWGVVGNSDPVLPGASAAYLRSAFESPPWGQTTNEAAMDLVFGPGQWDDLRYETVDIAALFAEHDFLYLEGSEWNAYELQAFLGANQTALEAFVAAGNTVFVNAAPNEGSGMSLGFGGVNLVYLDSSYTGNAAAPGHPIFAGPFTPVGTSFSGNSFSHASVSGGAIAPILLDDTGDASLAELQWGQGVALFGGMTTSNFHSPQPQATNLRANIIDYAARAGLPIVGVPDVDEYTVDLTGKAGQPIDVVLAGQGVDFSGETLQLLDSNGVTVLATAVGNPMGVPVTNYDLGILNFLVPHNGVYTVRLTSQVTAGDYAIVVTDPLAFDTEPNDTLTDPLRNLDDTGKVLGYSGGAAEAMFADALRDQGGGAKRTQAAVIHPAVAQIERRIVVADDPLLHETPRGAGLDGVVDMVIERPDLGGWVGCSGSLLTTGMHILTAAHCVANDFGGGPAAGQIDVWFHLPGGDVVVPGATYLVHPDYNGDALHGYDAAVVELAWPAPSEADRYDLYRAPDELAQLSQKVGYGSTGTGWTGSVLPGGIKHDGRNVYDALADIFDGFFFAPGSVTPGSQLAFDFDNGAPLNDAFDSWFGIPDTGLADLEVNSAPGDSGGPTFINGLIAGITSYGFGFVDVPDVTPGITDSSFGEMSVDTRVSFVADWIDRVAVDPRLVGPTVVRVVTPDSGFVVGQITIEFSETIMAVSAINPGNYGLVYAGGDGLFGTGDDETLAVTPAFDGDRLVTLAVAPPSVFPALGQYRLTIEGDTSIVDLDGNPLNSRNGPGGGSDTVEDFELTFTPPPGSDLYQVTVPAGGILMVQTRTPLDNAASTPQNNLDPMTVVYNPAGQPIALDYNSGSDGKNVSLRLIGLPGGVYTVLVGAEQGVGEYLLEADGMSMDFGDAPDLGVAPHTYPTLLASDGARHVPVGPRLGNRVDGEPDGLPHLAATGDDTHNWADEDGVTFTSAIKASPTSPQTATVRVNLQNHANARLDAWLDFNRNGSWTDANEKIFNSQAIVMGNNTLTFTIPVGATVGDTYVRFRVSTGGGLTPHGMALDGEVEDYRVTITSAAPPGLDFGDAPVPYPTLLAANGARHTIAGPRLGNTVLSEANGTPGVPAADDDGVVFTSAITTKATATTSATVRVNLQNQATAFLDAWLDFSRNGSWLDRSEQIFKSQRLVAGDNNLRFVVPAGAKLGTTYVRFRVSSTGNLLPTGATATGEVEDYLVTIVAATAPNTVVSPTFDVGGASGGEGETEAVLRQEAVLVGATLSPATAAPTVRSVSPAVAVDSILAREPAAAESLLAYLTRARGVNLNADNVDRVWRSVAKSAAVTASHDWLLTDWDDAELAKLFGGP